MHDDQCISIYTYRAPPFTWEENCETDSHRPIQRPWKTLMYGQYMFIFTEPYPLYEKGPVKESYIDL